MDLNGQIGPDPPCDDSIADGSHDGPPSASAALIMIFLTSYIAGLACLHRNTSQLSGSGQEEREDDDDQEFVASAIDGCTGRERLFLEDEAAARGTEPLAIVNAITLSGVTLDSVEVGFIAEASLASQSEKVSADRDGAVTSPAERHKSLQRLAVDPRDKAYNSRRKFYRWSGSSFDSPAA